MVKEGEIKKKVKDKMFIISIGLFFHYLLSCLMMNKVV